MFENIAIQTGIFITLSMALHTIFMWVMASISGVRVEEAAMFFSALNGKYQTKINKITLSLGWLPLGSYIKLAGMSSLIDSSDSKHFYFSKKSFVTRFTILIGSSLVLMFIGLIILFLTTAPNTLNLLSTYFEISFFSMSMTESQSFFNLICSNAIIYMGFIFFVIGGANVFTNMGVFFRGGNGKAPWFVSLFPLLGVFFLLGAFRLLIFHFSWIGLLDFVLSAIATGVVVFIFYILMAKTLRNQ